ncbi:MAG: hypothetical protein Q8R47_03450 [Nanoarchaeota archaeon]|nr:hypothetical protein [Nanoarchaeota archaeon]
MSLQKIISSFQQGRKEARILYDDNAPVVTPERELSSYSRTELVSYYAGLLSRPKAVYEIAKFFVSGQASGGQGISPEELDDHDPLNTKKQ